MKSRARLTLDMSTDDHAHLKMTAAKLHMSMKQFLMTTVFERIEELEDEWLEKKARKTLEDIELGKEKTVPWDEARKRLLK